MTDTRRPTGRRGVLGRVGNLISGGPKRAPAPKVAPPHPLLNNSVIDCALYVDGIREAGGLPFPEAMAQAARNSRAFVWLGLHEPDAEEFGWVAEVFGLHELAVEEATATSARPKIERFGDHTRIVLRTARYVEHAELNEWSEVVETGHITVFIGPRFVVTVRHGAPGALTQVRTELEKHRAFLAQGPWSVAHAICDRLVDTYVEVADEVEEDVNRIEEAVFARQRSEHIAHIYQLKRELVEFRRAVVPLQRPMQALLDDRTELPHGLRRYFKAVADHLNRVVDQINTQDELLNTVLQARLAQLTVEQNNDMRKIASWAAIAAVETLIVGVYGMNFDHMPELGWRYGYYGVLVVMGLAGVGVYRILRRSGWL
jgi:magnesium transporter